MENALARASQVNSMWMTVYMLGLLVVKKFVVNLATPTSLHTMQNVLER